MIRKRLWIALMAIPICLVSVLVISAEKLRPARAGGAIDPTCTSSSPCIEYQNTSTGSGLEGVSKSGQGLWGSSTSGAGVKGNSINGNGVYGISTNFNGVEGSSPYQGVYGTSTVGTGVYGTSTKGTGTSGYTQNPSNTTGYSAYGVFGNDASTDGGTLNSGVYGRSTYGVGVRATSTDSDAIVATARLQPSILASTSQNDGINSSTQNNSSLFGRGRSGIYAHDDSTDGGQLNVGVEGASINGIGVRGNSTNFVGVDAEGGYYTTQTELPALSVVGDISNSAGPALIAACQAGYGSPCGPSNGRVFVLDQGGNIQIAGRITTAGSCASGCTRTGTSSRRQVRFFTPRESLPTVEDFGEAQLVNGQAYVRLDPAFANTMDPRANYMVFITPEGDSRGVYVTTKTTAGFVVRENEGGRSTLAFSYRIVAKPYGEHPTRLQMFTMTLPRANPQTKPFPPSR